MQTDSQLNCTAHITELPGIPNFNSLKFDIKLPGAGSATSASLTLRTTERSTVNEMNVFSFYDLKRELTCKF